MGLLGVLALAIIVVVVLKFLVGDGLYSVSGQVLRAGKPIEMPDCQIVFVNREKGVFVPAKLGPDGKFEVKTAQGVGLPADTYEAYISFPPDYLPPTAGPMTPLPPQELEKRLAVFIPKKYRNPKSSGLTLSLAKDVDDFNVDMIE